MKAEKRRRKWGEGWSLDKVLERAGKEAGLPGKDLVGRGKGRSLSRGQALACYWLVRGLGHRTVDVANWLGIGQPAVSHCVVKGKVLAESEGLKLEKT